MAERLARGAAGGVGGATAAARLEDVPARGCRWPYGDGDVRFCGGAAGQGSVYCPAHRGLAYVPDASGFDAEALAVAVDRREARRPPTAA